MKRFWVKLTLEIREYDEKHNRIKSEGILSDFATNLTPEPAEYIRGELLTKAESLAKLMEQEADTAGTDLQSLDSEANSRQAEAQSGAREKGRL